MRTSGRLDSCAFMPARKSGFTITELIAVIAILAMVVAIAIPTLSSVYSRARSVVGEANLRTHAQVLSMYANDNAGWMPYFGGPGPDPIGFEFDNQSSFPVMFFDTHRFWHLWISSKYYDQTVLAEVFRAPWDEDEIIIESAYLYPCVYLASPSYWRAESRMIGDSQLRGTRIENVRFPSRKSLVVLPPNKQLGEDAA
jgi:prepilin-type N-terminal cleavage/methylation domain-containing protein